jgi:hypothetical protein
VESVKRELEKRGYECFPARIGVNGVLLHKQKDFPVINNFISSL